MTEVVALRLRAKEGVCGNPIRGCIVMLRRAGLQVGDALTGM